MALRFVHTADLHLDSPLRSLALKDPELAALIGTATREALGRIVRLCLDERVDALLIAGDLYDGDQTSMKTARALAAAFGRLHDAGIAVLAIKGNHDAAARITGALELPPNTHVFGARPATRRIEAGGVSLAVHGASFAREAPEAPLARFPAPEAGAVNLGMLHTSLGGAPGHDVYAPVSAAELAAVGYDYWALGHLHARQVLAGPPVVVMPGMPQGRDIGEAGAKSVTLATIHPDGRIETAPRSVALAEFARAEVALEGVTDWPGLEARLEAALEAARPEGNVDHLVLRLRLTGATPLAARLRRDADAVEEAARAVAEGLRARGGPGRWVETVELAVTPPGMAPADGGALAELSRWLADPPESLTAEAEAIRDEVMRALPAEVRAGFPVEDDALRDELLREGIADALAWLQAEKPAMGGD